jgi:hypothetical protein
MRPSTPGRWPKRNGPSLSDSRRGFCRSPPPDFATTASWPPPRLATAASLRRSTACELDLAGYGSLSRLIPWLAGTPSPQALAPASAPGRDSRCSPHRLDRQGLFASSIAGKANHRRLQRFSGDSSPHRRAQGQDGVRRRTAHNGLELSCPAFNNTRPERLAPTRPLPWSAAASC